MVQVGAAEVEAASGSTQVTCSQWSVPHSPGCCTPDTRCDWEVARHAQRSGTQPKLCMASMDRHAVTEHRLRLHALRRLRSTTRGGGLDAQRQRVVNVLRGGVLSVSIRKSMAPLRRGEPPPQSPAGACTCPPVSYLSLCQRTGGVTMLGESQACSVSEPMPWMNGRMAAYVAALAGEMVHGAPAC